MKKFARTDRYGSRVRQKHSTIQASLFAASHAVGVQKTNLSKSTHFSHPSEVIKSENKFFHRYNTVAPMHGGGSGGEEDPNQSDSLSMQQKFELFQTSILNNPLISQALQRRRFSMVSVLERGTPGPPQGIGRDLQYMNLKPKQSNAVSGAASAVKKAWKRSGSVRIVPAYSTEGRAPRISSNNSNADGNAGIVMSRFNAAIFPRSRIKSTFTEQDNAATTIQQAYRRVLAKTVLDRMKVIAKPGGGKSANKMSGAVKLGWAEIAGRFVRYLSDHFWEVGESSKVNVLIIETLLAHLIKARTYFFDVNNVKLPEHQIEKAHRLEFHKPQQLTKSEFNAYNTKKEVLNSLGVTELLARILASLCDDVTVDGLPDRVVQLLVELLDGGNKYVQQTLYNHLVNIDSDGKFLSHIEKRMHHAFSMYIAGKKMSKLTKTTKKVSKNVSESCEYLIQTFRMVQLLCDGHHLGFQDFLRVQSGHTSSQVNIVKTTCEYVIQLCDSKEAIERFSNVEISLLSQVGHEGGCLT